MSCISRSETAFSSSVFRISASPASFVTFSASAKSCGVVISLSFHPSGRERTELFLTTNASVV